MAKYIDPEGLAYYDTKVDVKLAVKVSKDGDTMTGPLEFQPDGAIGKSQIMKNADGVSDYGTILRDTSEDAAVELKLSAENGTVKLAKDGNEYVIYHEGNLPDSGRYATGSYVGTGTESVTLTFDGVPKALILVGTGVGYFDGSYVAGGRQELYCWFGGQYAFGLYGEAGNAAEFIWPSVTASDNTLALDTSYHYANLTNAINRPYHYIVFF